MAGVGQCTVQPAPSFSGATGRLRADCTGMPLGARTVLRGCLVNRPKSLIEDLDRDVA
jgi:hypothetical protein